MWHVVYQSKMEKPNVDILEHLRYAGTISIQGFGHTAYIPHPIEDEFDKSDQDKNPIIIIHEPRGVNGKSWAETQVRRISSFGNKVRIFKL